MGAFEIHGGNKLKGNLIPQGAKNEALQVINAVLVLAAIPAVVFYNHLSAACDRIISDYEAFADEFSTILSRQLGG